MICEGLQRGPPRSAAIIRNTGALAAPASTNITQPLLFPIQDTHTHTTIIASRNRTKTLEAQVVIHHHLQSSAAQKDAGGACLSLFTVLLLLVAISG